jgi:anti-sigma B factor antagonist
MQMLPLPDMRVHLESLACAAVVRVSGEIDVLTMGPLMNVFDEAVAGGSPVIVADLTEVSFIDSSGLSGLLGLHRRMERQRRQLVVAASSEVRRVVELAALDQLLQLTDERP